MVSESGSAVATDLTDAPCELPETVIHPRKGWESIQLSELCKHRHLIYFFIWRDLKVRYKQTALGALWAILQPTLMMVVFGVVFGKVAGMSSGNLPYPIFLYSGLLPWIFVSQATGKAAGSVVASERLVQKVYFPRLTIPISAVGGALFDFAIAFSVLILMMFWYGIAPSASIVFLPLAVLMLCLTSLGIGIFYASLNITYRDFRHLIGFLLQLWMFATPSIYMPVDSIQREKQPAAPAGTDVRKVSEESSPPKTVEGRPNVTAVKSRLGDWISVLDFNPLTAVISFFRATVLGTPLPWFSLAKSSIALVLILAIGLIYFRRVEDIFADII